MVHGMNNESCGLLLDRLFDDAPVLLECELVPLTSWLLPCTVPGSLLDSLDVRFLSVRRRKRSQWAKARLCVLVLVGGRQATGPSLTDGWTDYATQVSKKDNTTTLSFIRVPKEPL